MFRKMIISMVLLPLVLLFTSACWAEENPFENITGPNRQSLCWKNVRLDRGNMGSRSRQDNGYSKIICNFS